MKRTLWSLLLCAFCASAQVVHTLSLSGPLRTVAMNADHTAKWERGKLLRFDDDTSTVFALDRSGKVVTQAQIHLDQAIAGHIWDVSVSPQGTLAVALEGLSKAGAAAGFIVWLDGSGKTAKLVQLPFGVWRVCFADDGTLWAQVIVPDRGNESSDYDVLRHYDSNGVLIGTAVPRLLFATKNIRLNMSSLVASPDRIGLYEFESRTWVEVSYVGKLLGSWKMPDVNSKYARVYLSSSNDVYVYAQERRDGREVIAPLRRFDKAHSALEDIDTSAVNGGRPVFLWGIDGDELVVGKQSRAAELVWVKQQNTSIPSDGRGNRK